MQPTGTECRVIAIIRFSLITFFRRKGMNRHVKRFFEMNDSVRTQEMKTISVDKGSIIQ